GAREQPAVGTPRHGPDDRPLGRGGRRVVIGGVTPDDQATPSADAGEMLRRAATTPPRAPRESRPASTKGACSGGRPAQSRPGRGGSAAGGRWSGADRAGPGPLCRRPCRAEGDPPVPPQTEPGSGPAEGSWIDCQ